MQQRERTSQQISETEEWTITYGHGQLQSKRKRSQFERQTSWAPIIPQPSASGRVSRSFLDTWSWMLLHSQWFWREKNINVNRSHPVQSYFSKPSKQANMKLSLPDISTWLLPHPMSSVGIVSTWGGALNQEARTHLHLFLFFPSPKSPSFDASLLRTTYGPSWLEQLSPTLFFQVLLNVSLLPEAFLLLLFCSQFRLPSALSLHAQFTAKMFLQITGYPHPWALAPPCRTLVHCDTASSWQSIYVHTPFPVAQDSRSSEWLSSLQAGEGRDLEGMGFRRPEL